MTYIVALNEDNADLGFGTFDNVDDALAAASQWNVEESQLSETIPGWSPHLAHAERIA